MSRNQRQHLAEHIDVPKDSLLVFLIEDAARSQAKKVQNYNKGRCCKDCPTCCLIALQKIVEIITLCCLLGDGMLGWQL